MKQFLKVKDHPNLIRDPVSKAIINLDTESRKNYKNQKAIAELSVNSLKNLKDEVDGLKNDMNQIKDLLQQIINR